MTFWSKLTALFTKQKSDAKAGAKAGAKTGQEKAKRRIAPTRIGELGEFKIDVQLRQMPKEYRYISDVMIKNPKSRTGYSQIDHILITPHCVFVIETKNYAGEIKGNREDRYWRVSGRFRLYNPLRQNYAHVKVLEKLFSSHADALFVSMVSFTMRCRFGVDPELRKIHSNELVIYDVELTEYVERKLTRLKAENPAQRLSEFDIERMLETIQKANIVDEKIRAEHNEKAGGAGTR